MGPLGLAPGELTDAAWDYVLLGAEYQGGEGSAPREALEAMRREFTYWYPMDLRVSGKDLIQNHLTMSLYNHAAIWGQAQGEGGAWRQTLPPCRGAFSAMGTCWWTGRR